MEHTGFEPVASTLRTLRAPSCANAPSELLIYNTINSSGWENKLFIYTEVSGICVIIHSMNMFHEKKELNMAFRIGVIVVATVIFALNINSFVHTAGLIPGGATGLTLLIQEILLRFLNISVPFTPINILLNAIPVYIGFRYIGRKFTILSVVVIVLSSVFTDLFPPYALTNDILLLSIFGGIINGIAISMCLMADATSGGTDFISIYLSEKRGIDSFNIILGFNAVILCVAGALFSWDKALYSIIFQYASTTTIRLLYRKYQQTTLFIVTTKYEEVSNVIFELTHHGATIIEGEGSYEHNDKKVVFSVVASNEVGKVVAAVKDEDPKAFVNIIKTERVRGKFHQERVD